MLNSQEHYDLMSSFERTHRGRMDKEPKEFWSRGRIYQDGKVNELFLAYRNGYAYFATLDKIAACLARDPKRAERLAEALEEIRSRSSINLAMQSDPFELTARLGDIYHADAAIDAAMSKAKRGNWGDA